MTNVVTDRLTTDEKKTWLTNEKLVAYREVVEQSGLLQDVDGVIDGECKGYEVAVVVVRTNQLAKGAAVS